MNKNGPIIIIDDDTDDQEILTEIFNELGTDNEIKMFSTADQALAFISRSDTKPFIILSDINLPKMGGFELREQIRNNKELHNKCIPYIFITTGATKEVVEQAYSLSVQGIFQKPVTYQKWKEIIEEITGYWCDCMSPNRY